MGLWFAEKLARPIGRLAGAAQRVGAGDLSVRVPEDRGDDEIDREPGQLDELTVVAEHAGSVSELDALRDELREATVMRIEVRPVPPRSLERFAGKAKRVIDRRVAD